MVHEFCCELFLYLEWCHGAFLPTFNLPLRSTRVSRAG
jgi:hypothetical protein